MCIRDRLKYQDESGMWYQVVNYGGMEKNYLETSGSSIMAYAILKGDVYKRQVISNIRLW